MKKALLLILVLVGVSAIAQNHEVGKEILPPLEVEKAFQKEFPKITPTWRKEYRGEDDSELNYDADFVMNSIHMTAIYTALGVFKVLQYEVATSDVPAKAMRYLKKNYPQNKIIATTKVMDNSNKITYEIGIEINGKLSDAVFTKEGVFLEMVQKNK
ncbi:hypothetical protein [Flavobacterium sp.]|uniref:hypothetical protein n=1 Tax=Flavobacterium sp. TaxID=239 RepID=UPI002FD987D9